MQSKFEINPVKERKIATLAHASVLLTFIIGVTTGGIATLIAILVPLGLWYVYKEHSTYIAFHALQATLFQLAAVLIGFILGIMVGLMWFVVMILSIVGIGLLLIPVAIIISLGVGIIFAILILGGLTYGLVAAWEVYNNNNFRYYWLADRIETQVFE